MPGSDSMSDLDIQFGDIDWKDGAMGAPSASPSSVPKNLTGTPDTCLSKRNTSLNTVPPKASTPVSAVKKMKFRQVGRQEWEKFLGKLKSHFILCMIHLFKETKSVDFSVVGGLTPNLGAGKWWQQQQRRTMRKGSLKFTQSISCLQTPLTVQQLQLCQSHQRR